MSSSTTRSWSVAGSVGAAEALKDQGISGRWNDALRSSIKQHGKNNVANSHSHDQTKRSFSSKSSANSVSNSARDDDQKMKLSEDALRTVMYLSCWGPNN